MFLRHGVIFQDGTPFNAAAVVFNINRFRTNTNPSTSFLTTITSVVAKGKYTVVIHMSAPDSNLITTFATYSDSFMVSPTAFNTLGATQFGLAPVGAGPFKVTSFQPSISLTLVAWPGYWDRAHRYLTTLNLSGSIQTAGDQIEQQDLVSGSISGFEDGSGATVSVLQSLSSNPNIETVKELWLSPSFIVTNTTKPPFNNLLAREALDYCLNRPALADGHLQRL